jgi:predicted nucleic acid-binding protein
VSFVLDASVALAWSFVEERTAPVMDLLDRVTREGAAAPQIWPLEVLNALLAAERRGRVTTAGRRERLGLLRGLRVAIDSETAAQVWSGIGSLAEAHGLTAYDAAYLELAIRLGTPLATSDKKLATAAATLKVPLLLQA